MSDAATTRDQSVWDIFPIGIILPWYSTDPELPKQMQGKWAICDGHNKTPDLTDGRYLRGVGTPKTGADTGGANSHRHGIGKGPDDGSGFQAEGPQCRLVNVASSSNEPQNLNVRFIMRVDREK